MYFLPHQRCANVLCDIVTGCLAIGTEPPSACIIILIISILLISSLWSHSSSSSLSSVDIASLALLHNVHLPSHCRCNKKDNYHIFHFCMDSLKLGTVQHGIPETVSIHHMKGFIRFMNLSKTWKLLDVLSILQQNSNPNFSIPAFPSPVNPILSSCPKFKP